MTLYRSFIGKLDNKTLPELRKKFYSEYFQQVEDAGERLKIVETFFDIEVGEFFDEYVERIYHVSPVQDEVVADGDNVLQFLAMIGDYLVRGNDKNYSFEPSNFISSRG